MIKSLLWAVGLGLAVAAHAVADDQPRAKLSKMQGAPKRFELGKDLAAATAVLKQHEVTYKFHADDQPVPAKSVVVEGTYAFGETRVSLYFVDDKLWQIKLRGSNGLCEQHTADLGPPVREKDGCKFWFDKAKLFSAFTCSAGASHGTGGACFILNLQPVERAGVKRELVDEMLKALSPPEP